jgi:hypothetical protein
LPIQTKLRRITIVTVTFHDGNILLIVLCQCYPFGHEVL